MKFLKKTLSLVLALCLAVSLTACIPTQTVPTDPSTEATSPTEEVSVPTESNPTIPTETIRPTTGETITDPTTAPTVPPEESTDLTEDTTAPTESGETEPTEPPIQFPLSYSDSSATITIKREWFEDAWCYIAHAE